MPSRYRYWVSHEMMVLQFLLAIPLDPRPPTLHDFAGDQSEEFNLGALTDIDCKTTPQNHMYV